MAKNKVKFEETLARLEKIVGDLEGGELSLDEALAKYEEGVKLLNTCHDILRDAEQRVEIMLKMENGSRKIAPFELQGTEGIKETSEGKS